MKAVLVGASRLLRRHYGKSFALYVLGVAAYWVTYIGSLTGSVPGWIHWVIAPLCLFGGLGLMWAALGYE